MYCMKCGKQIEDTAKFCNYCGSAIKNGNQDDQNLSRKCENTVHRPVDSNPQGKIAMFVIVGLLACIIIGCIFQNLGPGSEKKFAIEGSWKSVGDYGFGQAQPGAIVVFDGTNCNFFSPNDTYAFYKENVEWRLDCTSMLLSDTMSFRVEVIDYDNIDRYSDSYVTKLKRVN